MSLVRVRLDEFDIISHEDEPASEGDNLVVEICVSNFDISAGGVVLPLL